MHYAKHEAKDACRAFFHGVWSTLPTPFTPDFEIDEDGLRSTVVKLAEDFRVAGVYAAGGVGEFWALTVEEHKRVIEVAVAAARGQCGVVAQTCHHSVADTIAITRHAQDIGADFASLLTPAYPRASEEGLYRYFKEVANAVDIGIWLVDTGLAGQRFSLDLTARLAAIPNICGLKLQHGIEHFRAVKKLVGDSLLLSDTCESNALDRMREGQQVFISSPAPFLLQAPGDTPLVDYIAAASRGDWALAESIHGALKPRRDLYARFLSGEHTTGTIAVPLIKAWAARHGLATGPVRAPLAAFPDAERVALYRDLDRLFPKAGGKAA